MDDTVSVATFLGAKVFYNAWPGYGLQKRFGEDQCRNKWLLNLDADEEITPELAREIQALFTGGEPQMPGYIVKVRDLLPGEKKLAWLAHTNFCIRLYNREKGRFSDSPVHDSVILHNGEAGKLQAPVLHRSFRNISHALQKMNSYSSAQAENLRKRGLALLHVRLGLEYSFAFYKAYLFRLYILRGWRGFIYANLYAFGRMVRIAKYWEEKKINNPCHSERM
jgi:glycosyltransferase involved in cell wall biosynthesis